MVKRAMAHRRGAVAGGVPGQHQQQRVGQQGGQRQQRRQGVLPAKGSFVGQLRQGRAAQGRRRGGFLLDRGFFKIEGRCSAAGAADARCSWQSAQQTGWRRAL